MSMNGFVFTHEKYVRNNKVTSEFKNMSVFGCCCDQWLLDGVLIPPLSSEQDQIKTWPKLFSKYFYVFTDCNKLVISL